jgi:methionyl-tRNA formyltransferase
MRLILMGTGPFAIPAFRALFESSHSVEAVVTRPVPAPRGRRREAANPVREAFEGGPVPVWESADVNDEATRRQLANHAPDLLVVCDFGQILSRQTLAIARCGGINLHASLLPKYRGAAPINWAIWNGELETGVTVIHMTSRLDAGPCLTQVRTPIAPDEDAPALEHRLAQLGVEPVLRAVALLEQWDGHASLGASQEPSAATRAPRLTKSDGRVDWGRPVEWIVNQVRALKPWPGTYTWWLRSQGPTQLILEHVTVAPETPGPPSPVLATARPGDILRAEGNHLWVATGTRPLAILRIKPAAKREMETVEFLRGYGVRTGDRWGNEAE